MRITEFITEAANPAQQAAIAIAKKKKKKMSEGSLNEFAVEPSDGGDDDEYDLLVKLVKMWWLGDEHQHVKAEKTLASMGISIDEDDPDIILRRGTQFLTFPMDDFQQGVAEGSGGPQITPGMKTQYGTVVSVSVKENTVTVKASNGELTTMNIHDIQQAMAEGGAKDRQWSNKDMERLRVATRDFDDIMASDGPEATKQNLIKKRIQTKPMAGPKGVLPEQFVNKRKNESI